MPHDEHGFPIVAHEFAGADCCGCLIVSVRGEQADISCNECEFLFARCPLLMRGTSSWKSYPVRFAVRAARTAERSTHFPASRPSKPLFVLSAVMASQCRCLCSRIVALRETPGHPLPVTLASS